MDDKQRKPASGLVATVAKYGIVAGPLFNISFILYVLMTDIALVGSYAWVSLGMPLGLISAFIGIFFVAIFNLNRRWVRFIVMAYGIFYIVIVTILPLPLGGNVANSLHNVIRLVTLSPWYATWERSPVYGVLSYASIACYAMTVVATIICEFKNPFAMDYLRAKKAPGRVFDAMFKSPAAREVGNALRHGKSVLVLITTVVLSGLFITGNQLWFAPQFTMEYKSDMLDDLRLEYWLGVDEQFTNGTFPLISPPVAGYGYDDAREFIFQDDFLEKIENFIHVNANLYRKPCNGHLFVNLGCRYQFRDDMLFSSFLFLELL